MVCRPVDIHETNRVTFHFQGFPISRVKKVLISYIDAKKDLGFDKTHQEDMNNDLTRDTTVQLPPTTDKNISPFKHMFPLKHV